MDHKEITERIFLARNALNELNVTGIGNMRNIVNIYDHLTHTAQMVAKEQAQQDKPE